MKESSKLKSLFAKDRGMPKGANYPAKFEKTAFEKGKKFKNLFKGLTVSGVASKLPKAAKNLGKVATVGKIARAATPIGLAATATKLVYDVATMSPEKKAKVKKLKTKLSKTSTKDYHADLLKANLGLLAMKKAKQKGAKGLELLSPLAMAKRFFNTGGDTMLKNPKKADLDKDGKLSSYEKKRGKAIESNMMKAYKGDMARGYGAARTQGQGLQDENLIPGKSLDYYKDLM
jgi:hypothetical protein